NFPVFLSNSKICCLIQIKPTIKILTRNGLVIVYVRLPASLVGANGTESRIPKSINTRSIFRGFFLYVIVDTIPVIKKIKIRKLKALDFNCRKQKAQQVVGLKKS